MNMFGNMFSGMFGKQNPMPDADMQMGDAIGQAAMGAPEAFGQGMPQQNDPRLAMMLMRGLGGFGRGMGQQQMPQLRNVYQNMSAPQRTVMFDPRMR